MTIAVDLGRKATKTNKQTKSMMRALLGAPCTDARLYTLRIKIGTRTTNARIVELISGVRSAMHTAIASYLEGGPLMWLMPLHVNQNSVNE